MIDYKYSELFTKNSVDKQFTIKTDDESVVITNLELNQENFELTESICSESELKFGCCEASAVKFRISDVRTTLKDKWLTITEVLDGNSDTPFQFGRYKVFSDKPTADKRYRDIVAYDAMFDIINADVAGWYNTILPTVNSTVTMKEFRTSFISYFGLEQEDVELANDSMIVEKTIEALQISGKDVISAICELNGCFGHIGRDGKFKYILLTKKEDELYPSDELYPADDLYIPNSTAINLGSGNYISCQYEDYVASRITKLQIRQEESDIGVIVGDEGNCYVVEDNFLVYGKSAEELEEIAMNIFDVIEGICFRPFSADLKGNPCYEAGDYIRFRTKYKIIESYILKRTLRGIQALRDTYEADGEEYYTERVNSVEKSIIQLKERTNKLTRSIDETKSEISKVETETKEYADLVGVNTQKNVNASTDEKLKDYSTTDESNAYADNAANEAEKNANNSTNEKLKSYSTTKEMNSAITQKANEINLSVDGKITETKTYAENVSTTAETNANNHTNEKLKDYSTTTQSNAYADEVAESAKNAANANTEEKLKSYSTTTEMNTAIQQKADSITLSVDKKVTETKEYADSVSANAENNAKASTDEKLKSYSTTTEMNTAIQQKADSITSAVSKTYATQTTVNNLQQQIDGAIETFTGSSVPTLTNAPANSWTTNAVKDTHIGDLYVVNSSGGNYAGFYYRFEKSGSTYQWTLLKDSEVTKALQDAKEANDKANAVADDLATNYSTTVEMNSAIEQRADSITSTVSQSQTKWLIDEESLWVDIYGYGTPANATASEYKGKHYLDMETGQVYGTITSGEGNIVWTLLGECKQLQADIYSKIQQNAYGISQKVSNGEVVSEINQSADTIELKGDRIIVDSTKWKVNKDGSQTCSDMNITGGYIELSGNTNLDTKMIVKNETTGTCWKIHPVAIRHYNADGILLADFFGGLGQLALYNESGSRTYLSASGISIDGSLAVSGSKSRLASTENYNERLLYCYETPSPMFGDLGEGKIDETGKCYIFLDDIFGETIDTDCVYQVFLQPYGKGDCYVTERTSSYFIVEGTENLSFGWELKAIQRDFDTMRLEEYQEPEQEETDVLSETYVYLTTLLYNPETEEIENE